MKKARLRLMGAVASLFLLATWCSAQTQPAAPSARAVIDKVLKDALAILRDGSLTKAQRAQKVREVAEGSMDFDTLAHLSLGANWQGLTDAQHKEFTEEFRKHVIATYAHTTDEYTNEDLSVAADHSEPRGDWTVQTNVIGDKDGRRQKIAGVDYRLRQRDGKWRIIDVTIDGVSLMANFRSQFQEIMSNGGYDRLIKLLREKNATAAK
jgi:phospholipid transport system substrate-binding protein